jgi:hypothetical protein
MEENEILLEVYNKREKHTESFYVYKLSGNSYKMSENGLLNCNLTYGTEFETKINKEGKHEVVRILKASPFKTRRFFLTPQYTAEDYRLLGDEIIKQGGFWQIDLGGIAIINLPKDNGFDIDEIFRIFDYKPTEIKD